MSKQFVMTFKVSLPDDIFEYATVLTSIKEVMNTLKSALPADLVGVDITSEVINTRSKRTVGVSNGTTAVTDATTSATVVSDMSGDAADDDRVGTHTPDRRARSASPAS